jgi:hypothetical protein
MVRAEMKSLAATIGLILLVWVSPALGFSLEMRGVGGSRAANQMALKIGLRVVPNNKGLQQHTPAKKTKQKQELRAPIIHWSSQLEDFFWGQEDGPSNPSSIRRIENDQAFPLLLVSDILSSDALDRVSSLLSETPNEEIEQHELVHGNKVSAIRRSLVSQLDPNGELLELLTSSLPDELVCQHQHHPYEDGSVISYRSTEQDFYAEHHDSFDPDETTLRTRQRAYTILVYLQTPPGPESNGGTEFTRLSSPIGGDGDNSSEEGLIVKPQAGNALIWPNFDRHGKPDPNSVHRALPVIPGQEGLFDKDATTTAIDKIVVNLWFEGHLK